MEPKEIHELIELISRSNFSTFELERDGFKIKLVRAEAERSPLAAAARTISAAEATASAEQVEVPEGLLELNSPIVGTFYGAPGPDTPNFVDVGSRVKKGQVLCIVEAMKVMNEIESEIDAEVVEVLVSNGQPVDYGEVLFRLRPS